MKKSNNFSQKIINWYLTNARDLPWRRDRDPYKIWISEIMLQQTTVNAVIPYYQRWIKKFPNIECVAKSRLQTILVMWQGLGYYQRARNIHKASKIICNKYKGKVPRHEHILKTLPGFGPYTTNAVLSIAYSKKLPIIDANVRRVFMRILAIKGFASSAVDPQILNALYKFLPKENIHYFNQGLMELGALLCRKAQPNCLICPVKDYCMAYKKGIQEAVPQSKRKILKEIDVVVGIIKRNGKYFIQKRPPSGLLANLWEFPGGKVEKGESAPAALRREMKEELDIEVQSMKHFMNLRHFYTQYKVNMQVYNCTVSSYPASNNEKKWVTSKSILKYPLPSGSSRIVDNLPK